MALIDIRDLSFGYDGSDKDLFSNINIRIDTTWRLALAGRNGRGKTTFIRLLRGELDYSGTITGVPETILFPQEYEIEEDWRIRKELNLMQTDPDIMYRPFETLSGGERTKLMLARLFARDGVYPLIDEPTNHLDRNGREALAEYLSHKDGFLLISHDRHFLDLCTDHTLVITRTGMELTSSTFSVWWDNNEQRMRGEMAQNEQLKKEISSLDRAMKQNAAWARKAENSKIGFDPTKVEKSISRRSFEGEKSRKIMSLSKNLQNRNEKKISEKQALLRDLEKTEKLKINGSEHHNRTPVILKDVCLLRDGAPVTGGLNMTIERGTKTQITGNNGCGKSTLIKYLLGYGEEEGISAEGDIYIAPDLKMSYVGQDTSEVRGIVKDIAVQSGVDRTQFTTILVKMGFTPDMLERDAGTLSLGQKKCVLIARSLCESADIYLWDEPLNYIDVYMRSEIERLVTESDITMLFVEHDAAFSENVADKTIMM